LAYIFKLYNYIPRYEQQLIPAGFLGYGQSMFNWTGRLLLLLLNFIRTQKYIPRNDVLGERLKPTTHDGVINYVTYDGLRQ
jgi:hypothetical protein